MSHSTSRPYGKWYDSARVSFHHRRWSENDLESLTAEKMDDEQERLRVADMMASRFVNECWPTLEISIFPPVENYSGFDMLRNRMAGYNSMLRLLRDFWKEEV